MDRSDDVLDDALRTISWSGPVLANGMISHAPMVAEALVALHRPDAVAAALDRISEELRPWPEEASVIDERRWRDAVGKPARASDLRVYLRGEFAKASWRSVLDRWVARLAPGAVAAALHGLVRTGHAVRALANRDTPARRDELASALAAWASNYAVLPTTLAGRRGMTSFDAALGSLRPVPLSEQLRGGSIVTALTVLSGNENFAAAYYLPLVARLDEDARHLAGQFARVFASNATDSFSAIAFVHGITGPAAVSNILPHVRRATGMSLLRHTWHAVCALYMALGVASPEPSSSGAPLSRGSRSIDDAIAHGDDHVIKLADACLAALVPGDLAARVIAQAIALLPPASTSATAR